MCIIILQVSALPMSLDEGIFFYSQRKNSVLQSEAHCISLLVDMKRIGSRVQGVCSRILLRTIGHCSLAHVHVGPSLFCSRSCSYSYFCAGGTVLDATLYTTVVLS